MVNAHPYTTKDIVRARCGNFDTTDVSNDNVDLVIEANADFVDMETRKLGTGWDDSDPLTNNYIKLLVTDFSAADILDIYVSRWAGESAKQEAKMIREWALHKLETLKNNLTGAEQDETIMNVIGEYETYDAMLHDGNPNPIAHRSTTFV